MPPKKINKFKTLHVGPVSMGLSKAAPSDAIRDPADDVQTGVLEDVHMCELEDTSIGPEATAPLTADAQYCNFCGRSAELLRACTQCHALVCEQLESTVLGCIPVGGGTVPGFVCPHCARIRLVKEYGYWGYGGRTHSKITWPLVVIHLAQGVKEYLRRSIEADVQNEYLAQPENLCVAMADLRVGGSIEATLRLRPTVDFLRKTVRSSYPANSVVIVESSSDLTTGAVAYGRKDEQTRYATLPNLVSAFLGGEILGAMADCSASACQANQSGRQQFFQDAAQFRGGWRGLVLVADGPTVRVPQRKDEAMSLVDRGIFDFVLTFTGNAVDPMQVRSFVSHLIRELAIDNAVDAGPGQQPVLWRALQKAVKCTPALLESTPVVFAFKERQTHETTCRQVAMHMPPRNAWGVPFKACGNGCTDVLASDFSFRNDKSAIRCHCTLCGWKSCRLKHEDVADLAFPLCPDLPLVYWYTYPPSAHLLDSFVRVSGKRRE